VSLCRCTNATPSSRTCSGKEMTSPTCEPPIERNVKRVHHPPRQGDHFCGGNIDRAVKFDRIVGLQFGVIEVLQDLQFICITIRELEDNRKAIR
jgi:hypothetical protein